MNCYDSYYDENGISSVVKPRTSLKPLPSPQKSQDHTHATRNQFRSYNGRGIKSKNTFGLDSICRNNSNMYVSRINENNYYVNAGRSIVTGKKGNALVPSVEEQDGRDDHYLSVFVENDNDRGSDNIIKPPPWSSSSSSSTTTSYSSMSADIHINEDGVQKFDCINDTFKAKIFNSRGGIWDNPTNDIFYYAIVRRRIATEAANEAIRRRAITHFGFYHRSRLDLDIYSYIITSIGCGSNTADAIHVRDHRPIWKQGSDHDCGSRSGEGIDQNNNKNGIVLHEDTPFRSQIVNIVEQAAAIGLFKQQNRKHQDQQDQKQEQQQEHQQHDHRQRQKRKENTMWMSENHPLNKNSKLETVRTTNVQNTTKDKQEKNIDCKSETRSEVFDSDGDTSTYTSSMQDTTATTSSTTRMFVALALTLGRIFSKLKKLHEKEV